MSRFNEKTSRDRIKGMQSDEFRQNEVSEKIKITLHNTKRNK